MKCKYKSEISIKCQRVQRGCWCCSCARLLFLSTGKKLDQTTLESESAAAAIPLLSVCACDVVLMLGATSPRLPQSVACVRAG